MATVFIPPMLQPMTNGVKQVEFEATNVRQVIEGLDQLYPGVKERLVEEGRIRPSLAVSVDGEVARMGMLEKVGPNSEVHFVPAIAGGMPPSIRNVILNESLLTVRPTALSQTGAGLGGIVGAVIDGKAI